MLHYFPFGSFFTLKSHFIPISFRYLGSSTKFHVLFLLIKPSSDFMASAHSTFLLASTYEDGFSLSWINSNWSVFSYRLVSNQYRLGAPPPVELEVVPEDPIDDVGVCGRDTSNYGVFCGLVCNSIWGVVGCTRLLKGYDMSSLNGQLLVNVGLFW